MEKHSVCGVEPRQPRSLVASCEMCRQVQNSMKDRYLGRDNLEQEGNINGKENKAYNDSSRASSCPLVKLGDAAAIVSASALLRIHKCSF